jgi:UDP-GlcNAc:undecaprenyl-phosphate GlcNAc-1-phosphate transferase
MFTIAIILSSAAALAAGLLLTPYIRELAIRFDFVDRPDGRRKMQTKAVALGGGAAVLASIVIGVGVLAVLALPLDQELFTDLQPFGSVLLATVMLCVVGLVDDFAHVRGQTKLIWQLVAASLVAFAGPQIESVSLFGQEFYLGHMGSLLALFWLLVSINSFNLIDGVDGLATSVGVIFGLTFGIMAMMVGNPIDGAIAFILAAALLGFLRYNFSPASIYLGDAGSMIIGLVLGTLALRSSTKEAATVAFAAPLAVWAIPMLDSLAAILRRKLTGRSIYTTDRGHIHHRLLTQGLSTRQAVALITGLCVMTSLGSLAGLYFSREWIGFATVLLVVGTLVTTRVFGHVELMLLNRRLLGIGRSIVAGGDERPSHSAHCLQGSLQWEAKIWNALVESAERFNLTHIRLNLYLPHLHEDFYATWRHRLSTPASKAWRIDLPLMVDGAAVGYLHVAGDEDPKGASATISSFLDFIEPLETQIQELLAIKPAALEPDRVDEDQAVNVELSSPELAIHPAATNGAATNGAASSGALSHGAGHLANEVNGAANHEPAYSQTVGGAR